MPLFLLTPATLAWSPFFLGYHSYLTTTCSLLRIKTSLAIGTSTSDPTAYVEIPANDPTQSSKLNLVDHDEVHKKRDEKKLLVATRALGNFAESVPLVLGSVFIAEANGAPTGWVHLGLAGLAIARIAHVEFGLKKGFAMGLGRPIGTYATMIIGLIASGYNFYIALDPTLNYFGF